MGAVQSLYALESAEYASNAAYPQRVESMLSDEDMHWEKTYDLEDDALRKKLESLTLDGYRESYKKDKTRFDLHDKYFQDLALIFTHGKSKEQLMDMMKADNEADRWLVRTRSVAMSTRSDVDWRGNAIYDDALIAQKKQELDQRWRFSRLFHWQLDAKQGDNVWNEIRASLTDSDAEKPRKPAPIEIVAQIPLDAVERLVTTSPTNKMRVAWVLKTTSHICCGNYTNPATLRWQGEHAVSTLTDVIASASLRAVASAKSPHQALVYRDNHHIALGGALVTKAKLLFVKKQPDTICLLVPFPRKKFAGNETEKAALAAEVLRAMAGVVKTALSIGVDVLVLPSGAAAQTAEEAYTFGALWGRVLRPTRRSFKRIVIAASPGKDGKVPKNVFEALSAGIRSTTMAGDNKALGGGFGVAGASKTTRKQTTDGVDVNEIESDNDHVNASTGDGVGGGTQPKENKAEAAARHADEVASLMAEAKARVEEEQAEKLLKEAEEAEAQRLAQQAAAEQAAAEDRKERAQVARRTFRAKLSTAMDFHKAKRFAAAVEEYREGLEALGEAYKLEMDPAAKEDLRLQFERYIRVAEAAKTQAKQQELDDL